MNKKWLGTLSRLGALILICVILTILSPGFLTLSNFMNIATQASLTIIVAAGLTLCMLIKEIDLSIGSVIALTSCMGATFLINEMKLGTLACIVVSLVLGSLIGLLNGTLITFLRLPSFLVTFGTLQIMRGFSYLYMSGRIFNSFSKEFLFIGKGKIFGVIPMPAIIALVVILVLGFVLKKTTFGRTIYAIGLNKSAAKYSGANVKKTTMLIFSIAGGLSALAGLVYTARLDAADAMLGHGYELIAISAAAIGGISFNGGRGSIFGTVIGALILVIIINGMNQLGIPTQWQNMVSGIVIIVAVLMDRNETKAII